MRVRIYDVQGQYSRGARIEPFTYLVLSTELVNTMPPPFIVVVTRAGHRKQTAPATG